MAFRSNDDAVTPLVGTLLLIAITVAMVGAVLVTANLLRDGEEPTPNTAFQKDSTNNRLQVITTPTDLDWSHIRIIHENCGLPLLNGAQPLFSGSLVSSSERPVLASEKIDLFPIGTCEVRLVHTPTNSLLGSWTFR